MKRIFCIILVVNLVVFSSNELYAQSISLPEVQHPKNATIRNNINQQKSDFYIDSKDILVQARKLKRLDSTYYVPWMLEGLYFQSHAADIIGFKKAAASLKKAYALITKDYDRYLKKRTSDIFEYFPVYELQGDFAKIADALVDAYSYQEFPDSAFLIASDYGKYNLQYEFNLINLNTKAWLVHRNRMFTQKKFDFLKSNVTENEQLAHAYLDSSLVKINKDKALNQNFFQPNYTSYLYYSVYHYKAILYGYSLDIDSALHYYQLMEKENYFSNNNFGNLQMVRGNFSASLRYYNLAKQNEGSEKQLKEWAYFSSMLHLFDNKPQKSVDDMLEMIKSVGSTPGYGWYNIALARALNYGGNVVDINRYLKKAEQFKETHIGTTLGETHYATSVALVKYHTLTNQIAWYKFAHKGWWYKPKHLWKLAKLKLQKTIQHYRIINLLKDNPERDAVLYSLFATESTVTWDEVLSSLDGLSSNYFLDYYQRKEKEDPRQAIKSYFKYAQAKILLNKAKYEEALRMIQELKNEILDEPFELLFRAKILILENNVLTKLGKSSEVAFQNNLELLFIYPQLLPFNNQVIKIGLNDISVSDEVLAELKKYQIDWTNQNDSETLALINSGPLNNEMQTLRIQYSTWNDHSYIKDITIDINKEPKEIAAEIVRNLFQIATVEE